MHIDKNYCTIAVMVANNNNIIGGFECIEFPEFSTRKILAKVDTGAYSGAVHATDVHLSEDGSKLLFRLSDDSPLQFSEHFSEITVRSALGDEEERYVVETSIKIGDQCYTARIGLSDRSPMKFQALLGRRFLREHGFLVDVRRNQQYDDDGDSNNENSDS